MRIEKMEIRDDFIKVFFTNSVTSYNEQVNKPSV